MASTYVSEPADGRNVRGIVVIIPDVFGWEFISNRILADHYVEKGDFKVYLLDFMNGNAPPVSMLCNVQTALAPGNIFTRLEASHAWHAHALHAASVPLSSSRPSKTYPSVKGFFEQLRKERGDQLSVGAAGFCWGYKHIVTLSHGVENAATPLIDAALTAHPSFLSIPSDIEKIKVPVSFACPEDDNQVTPPKIESIRSIVEKLPAASRGEVRVYENTGHGFAVRADLKVPDVAKQADGAEDQAVAWFHAQFKKP
ncbi:hypothetical protein EsHS_00000647 [Epichloe bromicola]